MPESPGFLRQLCLQASCLQLRVSDLSTPGFGPSSAAPRPQAPPTAGHHPNTRARARQDAAEAPGEDIIYLPLRRTRSRATTIAQRSSDADLPEESSVDAAARLAALSLEKEADLGCAGFHWT